MKVSIGANTVPGLLEERVAQSPEAPAFRFESSSGVWQTLTWRQFSEHVATLRRALVDVGLRKGDRLALIAPVSLEWELLHHAALAMGLVVVGLDAHDLPERIATMAEQADITAFATSDVRVLSAFDASRLAGCRLLLRLGGTDDAPSGPSPGGRWLNWNEFTARGAQLRTDSTPPAAEDTATIIFTSGTTGAPKGIAYSHAQLCLAIDAIRGVFGFVGPESRLLCWLPLSNLLQRMVNLAGLGQSACTYLLGDPRRVMSVVADVSPDIFVGVPRFYEKLYDGIRENIAALPWPRRRLVELAWGLGRRASRLRLRGRKLPVWLALAHGIADRFVLTRMRRAMGERLRCMVTGSAPTPLHLLEEFHALGWLVLEAYGLSENVIPMAMNRPGDLRFGTVGRPIAGNEIRVAEDGGILVRGPGVFRGYIEDGSAQRALNSEGFYRTGDFGRIDADGYLWLGGRAGDLIKTSTGRRIAPVAVEAILSSVPGVDQAMLLGHGRRCLVALCTLLPAYSNPKSRMTVKHELRAHLSKLGRHERPLAIALLDQPFSLEQGEITSNLKLRRTVIEAHHLNLIDRMYKVLEGSYLDTGDEKLPIFDSANAP
jgi:long-chain acyl-CoA synthetase